MTKPNYNMTLLLLLGLAPGCNIGDKNLGETGDGDSESETDAGPDLPGEEEEEEEEGDGDGDGDGDPTTCGNGIDDPNELCFEVVSLPVSGTALDVAIIDADGAAENSLADLVVLTNDPDAPLYIWHNDPDVWERLQPDPEIVVGPLPTPTIPGLAIADFDPSGIEYRDIMYATAEGVVVGWDKGFGDDNGFDDVTLVAACSNPMSFTMGHYDVETEGADVLCAHEADGGGIEVLLASNFGDRSFAPPLPLGSDLAALSPLRTAIDFSGSEVKRRFIAHDRVDQLIVWEHFGDEWLSVNYSAPALAWDLGLTYLTDGAELVVASHDPPGLLLMDENANGEFVAGELIPTEALPYQLAPIEITEDERKDLLVTLDSGHLGIFPGTDEGLGDPVLIEVGPEPRQLGIGTLGWTGDRVIAVTSGETVSVLYPDP